MASNQYIDVPIQFDETAIYNAAVARIQVTYPNWAPAPGSPIDMFLKACAAMAAIGAEVASDVPFDIFTAIGPLLGVQPIAATNAVATATITVQDVNGPYVIDANTPIGLYSASSPDPIGFKVLSETTVPNGQTSLSGVQLVSINPGAINAGLDTVYRTDGLSFVTDITVDAGSFQDGTDAMLSSAFANYMVSQLTTLTDTPILAKDAAVMVQRIPGIYRCGYLDNYNPDDGTSDNEKYLCICPVQSDGDAVSSDLQTQAVDLIESKREWNFVCAIDTPTKTALDVAYTANVNATTDQDAIEAAIEAALQTFLNPGTWGTGAGSGTGETPDWVDAPNVRWMKIAQVIEEVVGVNYTESVTIAVHGNALAAADITLPGAFPLPTLGTITPTFTTT